MAHIESVSVLIVGGGAAGLTATIASGHCGVPATLLERNPKLGIKILMSGGGRCNITNTGDVQHLVDSFPGNGRFLYSAFSRFTNEDIRMLLAEKGVETKVEDRGRVFPVNDTAREVVGALEQAARETGATIRTKTAVEEVRPTDGGFVVTAADGSGWQTERLILTVGGVSYPTSGTRGDGYRWAREMGHTIVHPRPAIIPIETQETWPAKVRGVALRGVTVYVYAGGKVVAQYTEDVLFTHFGLSGPAILNVSHQAVMAAEKHPEDVIIGIQIDVTASAETWRTRLDHRINDHPKRSIKNLFDGWWPLSLAETLIAEAGVDPNTQAAQVPRQSRQRLVDQLLELRLTFKQARSIEQAMVTAGGIDVREIDPRTMASRKMAGLYLAGEMLDVDGISGGYNLQAAYSTGWLAGEAAAVSLHRTSLPSSTESAVRATGKTHN